MPGPPDPLSRFLGFSVEEEPRTSLGKVSGDPGVVEALKEALLEPPRDPERTVGYGHTEPRREADISLAKPAGVRGPPPENTASTLADARLRGLIRTIIEERGMAVTVSMVQRALLEASHDARRSGRSLQGYIG